MIKLKLSEKQEKRIKNKIDDAGKLDVNNRRNLSDNPSASRFQESSPEWNYLGWEKDPVKNARKPKAQEIYTNVSSITAENTKKVMSNQIMGNYHSRRNNEIDTMVVDQITQDVHSFVMENDFTSIVSSTFKGGMLYPIATAKLWWDKTEERHSMRFKGIPVEQLDALYNTEDYEVKKVEKTGEFPNEMYDVQGSMIRKRDMLKIKPINFNNLIIDTYADSLEDIDILGERVLMTKSKIVDKYGAKLFKDVRDFNSKKGTEKMTITDVSMKIDYDGDNRIETIRVLMLEKEIVLAEEIGGSIPYAKYLPDNLPGTIYGRPVADRISAHENTLTEMMRSLTNAAYKTANPLQVLMGATEQLSDGSDYKANSVISLNDKRQSDFKYVSPPFPGNELIAYLENLQEGTRNIAGVGQKFDPPASSNVTVYESIVRNENAQAMNDYRLTVMGNFIKQVFMIALEILIQYSDVIPEGITADQLDFIPSIGYGIGARSTNVIALEKILDVQLQLLELGLPIANEQNIYNALKDWIELTNNKSDKYVTDPSTLPPPPEEESVDMLKEQIRLMEEQLQNERNKTSIQAQKAELDIAKAQNDADIDREKFEHDKKIDLEKIEIDRQKLKKG